MTIDVAAECRKLGWEYEMTRLIKQSSGVTAVDVTTHFIWLPTETGRRLIGSSDDTAEAAYYAACETTKRSPF